jgi:hypothetical protein
MRNYEEIKKDVILDIENNNENSIIDFKREQYNLDKKNPKKWELLKDLIAFANRNEISRIIMGYDNKLKRFYSVENPNDENLYREYVNSNVKPKIDFSYITIEHKNNKLVCLEIYGDDNLKDYYRICDGTNSHPYLTGSSWIREGTKNTYVDKNYLNNQLNNVNIEENVKYEEIKNYVLNNNKNEYFIDDFCENFKIKEHESVKYFKMLENDEIGKYCENTSHDGIFARFKIKFR